jgi:hypothetical protein
VKVTVTFFLSSDQVDFQNFPIQIRIRIKMKKIIMFSSYLMGLSYMSSALPFTNYNGISEGTFLIAIDCKFAK